MRTLISILIALVLLVANTAIAWAGPELPINEEFSLSDTFFESPWRDTVGGNLVEVDYGDDTSEFGGHQGGDLTHAYDTAGAYTVRARPVDFDPSMGTGTKDPVGPWLILGTITAVAPNSPPTARIILSQSAATTGEQITFDGSDSSDDSNIASYHWDFGAGISSTEQKPRYGFSSTGDQKVTLTVMDDEGATAVQAVTITVTEPPEPELEPEPEPAEPEPLDEAEATQASSPAPEVEETAEAPANGLPLLALAVTGVVTGVAGFGFGVWFERRDNGPKFRGK